MVASEEGTGLSLKRFSCLEKEFRKMQALHVLSRRKICLSGALFSACKVLSENSEFLLVGVGTVEASCHDGYYFCFLLGGCHGAGGVNSPLLPSGRCRNGGGVWTLMFFLLVPSIGTTVVSRRRCCTSF